MKVAIKKAVSAKSGDWKAMVPARPDIGMNLICRHGIGIELALCM